MKKNIAVIMGGYSEEFDISMKSGQTVIDHIQTSKYNVFPIIIKKTSWQYVLETGEKIDVDKNDFSINLNGSRIVFDLVFNTVHGSPGEDGKIQSYFDMIGIKHTSCDDYSSALTFNKRDTLSVLKHYDIQSSKAYYLNKEVSFFTEEIVKILKLPLFVKPNKSGSSIGISKVFDEEHLKSAIDKAFEVDEQILIESAIEGVEVSVGVITFKGAPLVLPMTEIIPPKERAFFDYKAKYKLASQEITPARITDKVRKKVEDISLKIYRLLNLKGLTRSEFIIRGEEVFLLEVNTTPGLSKESILPQQIVCAGMTLTEVFEDIITYNLRK